MRTASRVDANQPEIVQALRDCGAIVKHTHTIGKGFPDLIVGYRGVNYLLEVKDGSKPPSARKLTDDEQRWHDEWRGQVVVVNSVEEAISVINKE